MRVIRTILQSLEECTYNFEGKPCQLPENCHEFPWFHRHPLYRELNDYCDTCEYYFYYVIQICYFGKLNQDLFVTFTSAFLQIYEDYLECKSKCSESFCLKHFMLFVDKIDTACTSSKSFRFGSTVTFKSSLSFIFYVLYKEFSVCTNKHIKLRDSFVPQLHHYRQAINNWGNSLFLS